MEEDKEQPLIEHLVELRTRLVRAIIVIAIAFAICFPFAGELYTFLADPMLKFLPETSGMIATEVGSAFFIPFKLSIVVAIFVASPFLLYQIWAFVAPGLFEDERGLIGPLLFSSTALFFSGAAFAYYVVFPIVFKFFTSQAPEGVLVMTDISHYFNFTFTLFLAFGVAFEVPIAVVLAVRTGLVQVQTLAKQRHFVILGAFVIGMLLTPPDIISQSLLAVPMWLLFEVGLLFAKTQQQPDDTPEQELD